MIGIGALVFGIIEGPVKGWTSTETLGGFAAGVIFLAAFVGWELRTERPVLDVRLFRLRGFSTGSVSTFLQFFAAFGFSYVAAQFLAFVFGYRPLTIGLTFLPVGVGIPAGAAIATRMGRRLSRGVIGGGGGGLTVLAAGAELVGVTIPQSRRFDRLSRLAPADRSPARYRCRLGARLSRWHRASAECQACFGGVLLLFSRLAQRSKLKMA